MLRAANAIKESCAPSESSATFAERKATMEKAIMLTVKLVIDLKSRLSHNRGHVLPSSLRS
jgi:hypothetical protein